jgi:hypothetical protein
MMRFSRDPGLSRLGVHNSAPASDSRRLSQVTTKGSVGKSANNNPRTVSNREHDSTPPSAIADYVKAEELPRFG